MRAIIFDVDGTLAETEELHRQAFNRMFAEFGLPWAWDTALYGRLLKVAGGKNRIAAYMNGFGEDGANSSTGRDNARIAAMHARKTEIYAERVAAGEAALRPGIRALIEAAGAAGLRLAIATTTSASNVTALLRAAFGREGPRLFEVIAAGECAERKKPAPDVYAVALERLRLAAGDCIAIEDSAIGVAAAHGAGIPVLMTRSLYMAEDPSEGAVRCLGSLAELIPGRDPQSAAAGPALLAALRTLHAEAVAAGSQAVAAVA